MPRDQRLIDLMEICTAAAAEGRPVDPSKLCASCPELLPDLELLCRCDARMERLLSSVSAVEAFQLGTSTTPANVDPPPKVAGYTILCALAEGGMGRVYHARDTRLDRDVALKVIHPERISADLLERFQEEARAVAQLDHPHVVGIYEVGEYSPPGGGPSAPFLALEFVAGGTLESRAGTAPLTPSEAARIVALLARAMAHAHARGIVHRDLKPQNILVAPHADEAALNAAIGRPKVGDFGLARRQNDPRQQRPSPGTILGTPAYMAPEQVEGRWVGPPADVYALGGILYRLLTAHVVFEAPSVEATLHDTCNTPPRPPSELVPGIPPALEALCLRCLAKNPADRPSAAELATALEPGSRTEPLPVTCSPRRIRRWLVNVVTAMTLGLLLIILGWWLSRPPIVPLKGYLDALVTRPVDPLRQSVRLSDPAARPLRPGDEIRVRAELNRPAYVYLVWIDSEGKVIPMYPWVDGDWKQRGPEEKAVTHKLPQRNGEWWVWKMGSGKQGLETMVLLCRDDPLPKDVNLQGLLGTFGPQSLAGQAPEVVAWFENGETIRDEDLRAPQVRPEEGTNSLERVNREIQRRVQKHFRYTRAITYGNEGGVK